MDVNTHGAGSGVAVAAGDAALALGVEKVGDTDEGCEIPR